MKHRAVPLFTLVLCSALGFYGCRRQTDSPPTGKAGTGAGSSAGAGSGGGGAESGAMRLDKDRVIAKWDGGQITYGELHQKQEANFKKLERKYLQDVYAMEQQQLEGMIVETLVKRAAQAKGKSEEEYVRGIGGTPTISDQDIQEFYDKNVKSSGQPLDAVKDRVRAYLTQNKQQEAVKGEFNRLKSEAKVEMKLPAPETAVAKFELAGRPMRGKPEAKVTVVAFSDFQCPYCAKATPGVEALLQAYPDDVKVYFLHYPLSFHQAAMPAAIASQCAHLQGKFWQMHDKLFENQQSLTEEKFLEIAKAEGLDVEKFSACSHDPATRESISSDMKQAEAAGVNGTPSFFINGVQYSQGVPTVEAIRPYLGAPSSAG